MRFESRAFAELFTACYLHRIMAVRPAIQRKLNLLKTDTDQLLEQLSEIPRQTLEIVPPTGGWSTLQAVNHMYLAEQLAMRYLQYKIDQGASFPLIRPDAWVRTVVLGWVLSSRMKFKSPPQINMENDQPVVPIAELREQWTELRQELVRLLEAHEDRLKWRLPFKHPRIGKTTIRQMLVFFQCHHEHHVRQIHRILEAVKGPEPGS
jgi:uncharacterized damage-inducible protein DinB